MDCLCREAFSNNKYDIAKPSVLEL